MTVDIRLCGNLTRKEVNDEMCQRSSLYTLRNLSIPNNNELTTSSSLCSFSAFNKATLQDGLSRLLLRNQNLNEATTSRQPSVIPDKVPISSISPIVDPPTWAEPAKGEARLEVRTT